MYIPRRLTRYWILERDMHVCWSLSVALLILLGGFGLFSLHLIADFTATMLPMGYIVLTVLLPSLIVGPLWLGTAGARIRQWRLWNLFARNTQVHIDPGLQDIDHRIDANVAYAYIVEYETPTWETDIPLEAMFTFVLPGTRDLQLRELPTVFASTALVMEPWLGWLLPYVGVQEAPPQFTLRNAFKALPGTRDVVLLNPSDPLMPIDGFVAYESYFFEVLRELEYHVVPVRIQTARRIEHTYTWYGRFVPAITCLFGVAPASLPLAIWSWLRRPVRPRTQITMGAPRPARDLTFADMRALLAVTRAPEENGKGKTKIS